jgi:hypothetical protein
VDDRTDLWALSVLLYQLLTGINPYNADSVFESLDRILDEVLPLPSEIRPELDPEIDDIIFRALMPDKMQRFGSVSEFSSEISDFLGDAQSGRKILKYRINERDLDELVLSDAWHQESDDDECYDDETGAGSEKLRLWDRLPQRLRGTLGRLSAAAACGSFACAGLSGFDLLAYHNLQSSVQFALLIGIVALIALGAFLVPQLGSSLACIVFIAGIFARGLVIVAIILALLLFVWWLFCGRKSAVDATLVMFTPLLGALWMGFALPLLSGYFLKPKRALSSILVQGFLLIVIAAITGSAGLAQTSLLIPEQLGMFPDTLIAFLLSPMPWIMFAAFIIATLAASFLSARNARSSAIFGTMLATAVIGVGSLASLLISNPSLQVADFLSDGIGLALSFILLSAIFISGISTGNACFEEV